MKNHQPSVKNLSAIAKQQSRQKTLAKSQTILAKVFLLGLFLLGITACGSSNPATQESPERSVARTDTNLVLNNAILEQLNSQKNSLWRIKAERTIYSENKQTARLEKITANLLQDGKLILQVSAQTGEIQDDGDVIFLRDDIIISDPRNQSTMRSEEVEWRSQEHVLIVRGNLTGSQSNLKVAAKEGRYYPQTESLELQGNIIATTREPSLQLETEHLVWDIPQQKIKGDRPLQIVRYQEEKITDRLVADWGEVRLAENTAILQQNVELKSFTPKIQIATNSIMWNYQTRFVSTDKPVRVVDADNQLTVTGNQGQIDLNTEVAKLRGGVQGIDGRNKANLYSQDLVWNIPTQRVEATGNVFYQQSDPQMNLTGDKAVGNLRENQVVVSNNSDRVQGVVSIIREQ
ncbi:LPS export ABC transporter periplasmic protein LptC [Pleurocapsales cyanobacterium LEGE 06147]|nr:LPS export ABC transporter periplasmic protein LptC [Pleurocapsales cyanobacterium LEGE 06147]